MQGYQNSCEEELMLLLQGKRETIDDGTKYLQQLRDPIESFGLVHELEENIIY